MQKLYIYPKAYVYAFISTVEILSSRLNQGIWEKWGEGGRA